MCSFALHMELEAKVAPATHSEWDSALHMELEDDDDNNNYYYYDEDEK